MIPYNRDPRQVIPSSSVKIIGLGGAGTNMLERIALDGMDGAELLALNTDIRTLGACLAREKIQLGVNLTKGLGTGGDPELGHQAVLEAEDQIRASVKGRRIVFLCAGLGGGTGSGAAPIVTRIAREEGAFVVVFATMPFAFEGKRRRDQAETALNELAVLSNALVTFDNNRMGELVLAKQGIHEAFIAADHMICESMKAVTRLVIRPGLINVGLDDLMSALRTNRSRCLFGSGLASGKDRATRALRNALASPLLDQGALLKDAQTVLVHLCGGEDLTLFEIELLMQRLQKFVPEKAHVLFGAAVDPAMGDALSLTLISALPEDSLAMAPRDSLSRASRDNPLLDPSTGHTPPAAKKSLTATPEPEFEELETPEETPAAAPEPEPVREPTFGFESPQAPKPAKETPPSSLISKFRRSLVGSPAAAPTLFDEERPFAEPEIPAKPPAAAVEKSPEPEPETFTFHSKTPAEAPAAGPHESAAEAPEVTKVPEEAEVAAAVVVAEFVAVANEAESEPEPYVQAEPDPEPIEEDEEFNVPDLEASGFSPIPRKRPAGTAPWSTSKGPKSLAPELEPVTSGGSSSDGDSPKLKLGVKAATPQSELSLDSTPRGRFEGESPNVFDGEDLDLPPFLRKKK
jgi:cell division protein FtsZ